SARRGAGSHAGDGLGEMHRGRQPRCPVPAHLWRRRRPDRRRTAGSAPAESGIAGRRAGGTSRALAAGTTVTATPDENALPCACRRSLSRRIALAALGIGLLVCSIAIALQLAYAYARAAEDARRRLDEVGATIVPSLADSLWQVDLQQVQELLDGIARL